MKWISYWWNKFQNMLNVFQNREINFKLTGPLSIGFQRAAIGYQKTKVVFIKSKIFKWGKRISENMNWNSKQYLYSEVFIPKQQRCTSKYACTCIISSSLWKSTRAKCTKSYDAHIMILITDCHILQCQYSCLRRVHGAWFPLNFFGRI